MNSLWSTVPFEPVVELEELVEEADWAVVCALCALDVWPMEKLMDSP
jgi:hypothetical protein